MLNRYTQAQRRHDELKHRFTSTLNSAMGHTMNKVAIKLYSGDSSFRMWDSKQVVVALTRIRLGNNLIYVGDKNDTIKLLAWILQFFSKWVDYMDYLLITIK